MKPRPDLPDGPFVVVGLGLSGKAVALALRARGEVVIGYDSSPIGDEVRAQLGAAGVHLEVESPEFGFLSSAGVVVKSPGVPHEVPVIRAARAAGVPVVGELEIAWRLLPNEFIAVTGSNGKTTTVELVGHIYRTAGRKVEVAGNVGTALSELVGHLDPAATVVCEASSFQLEDTEKFAPEAAVLLNLTEDHLDRHGTIAAYEQAKLKVFANQDASDVAIRPEDLVEPTIADGTLFLGQEPLIALCELQVKGEHNVQNALAAATICHKLGIPPSAIREGLRTFAGVPHRLEPVAVIKGVEYINDSKATNVAATQAALTAFESGVHLILGGRGKNTDYTPLVAPVKQRCAALYLIGEDAPNITTVLAPTGVPLHQASDLSTALDAAHASAQPHETVLLAPAAASYDQYSSFEERGDHFRTLVEALK